MLVFLTILAALTVVAFIGGYISGRNSRIQWAKEVNSAIEDAFQIETLKNLSVDERTSRIVDRFKKLGFELDSIDGNSIKFILRTSGFLRRTWGVIDGWFLILFGGPLIPSWFLGDHLGSRRLGKNGELLYYRLEDPETPAISPSKKRWWNRLW